MNGRGDFNPYEAPRSAGVPPRPKRTWTVSILEFYVIFTILGFWIGLLYPAVNRANEKQNAPLLWPELDALFGHFARRRFLVLFMIMVGTCVPPILCAGLWVLRLALPIRLREYLPVRPSKKSR